MTDPLPDFGLRGTPAAARIVVAMSGGVDSSVVAVLAARTGAEVIGVTLQLYDHGAAVRRAGSCCAGKDIRDARAVCDRLGVAHYVLDYETRFRAGVIDRFADDYAAGRTPVPCSLCNQGVKFTDLIGFARELGATCLATGHYVRRVIADQGGTHLWRGRDPARDQSYFLHGTTPDQLDFLRFPLGDLPKSRVRAIALEAGLAVATKPDSQDICFVPDGDYAGLVKRLRPQTAAPGEIVDPSGRVLGRHQGVVHFTVGQRRGIDLGGQTEPLYVLRIDPAARRLVVGPRRMLAVSAAQLAGLNWLGEDQRRFDAKVRSMAAPVPVCWDGEWLHFDRSEFGVAPGQSAVFYDGDRVLGGGTIIATRMAEVAQAA